MEARGRQSLEAAAEIREKLVEQQQKEVEVVREDMRRRVAAHDEEKAEMSAKFEKEMAKISGEYAMKKAVSTAVYEKEIKNLEQKVCGFA